MNNAAALHFNLPVTLPFKQEAHDPDSDSH